MTHPSPAPSSPRRAGAAALWLALDRCQRAVALTALALLATMLLPWYDQIASYVVKQHDTSTPVTTSSLLTGFEAFSFAEAAVLLVVVGVLALVIARAWHRPFHLPGSDGSIVALAGIWAVVLIVFRIVDRPAGVVNTSAGPELATVNLEWGIFVALVVALLLAYAGRRMRQAAAPRPVSPPNGPPIIG